MGTVVEGILLVLGGGPVSLSASEGGVLFGINVESKGDDLVKDVVRRNNGRDTTKESLEGSFIEEAVFFNERVVEGSIEFLLDQVGGDAAGADFGVLRGIEGSSNLSGGDLAVLIL